MVHTRDLVDGKIKLLGTECKAPGEKETIGGNF